MFYNAAVLLAVLSAAAAAPIKFTREVPQEHSHEQFLTSVRKSLALNNPDGIADPVFGLLGNAAAAGGAGKITDLDCLHQATADQAFTNAKAAKDVTGMVDALVFATLERNTGKVGLASVLCTAIKAKNPEIAALTQHQDPASAGAAALNKKITLELAKQIASVGGDPLIALKSGTFAPGDLNDNTGKGNTCDNTDDPIGCIFTQNKLVEDATAAEIAAAVAGVAVDGGNKGDKTADDATVIGNGDACPAPEIVVVTVTVTQTLPGPTDAPAKATQAPSTAQPAATAAPEVPLPPATPPVVVTPPADPVDSPVVDVTPPTPAPTTDNNTPAPATPPATPPPATSNNLQTFSGALGDIPPPPITAGGRGFQVEGNDFLNLSAAIGRSCDIQHNQCANAANQKKGAFSVGDCDKQNNDCHAAGNA